MLLVNGRPAVRTRSPAPTPSGVSTASCPARSPPPNGGNGPTATPPSQPGRPPPPASPSRPPRQTTSPRSSPRPARSTALGLYLWLVAVTGVRRGELCGLQIRDIDLDRGLVHVAFNYVVRGGQRVRKYTKTHQDRWLAIDPATCALIANYLDEIRAGGTYQRNGQDRARPGYSGSDSPSRNPSSSGEPPPTQRGPRRSVPGNIGWSPASLAGTCPHVSTPCPQISIMARPRICPSSSATRASSICSKEYRLVTSFPSGNLSSRTHSKKSGKSVSGSAAPRLPQ